LIFAIFMLIWFNVDVWASETGFKIDNLASTVSSYSFFTKSNSTLISFR